MPRKPKNTMRIDVRCPAAAGGWGVKWSADAATLAKPGVEAMWATITQEVVDLVTRRYSELRPERPTDAD